VALEQTERHAGIRDPQDLFLDHRMSPCARPLDRRSNPDGADLAWMERG
jgi:hypothetical protein